MKLPKKLSKMKIHKIGGEKNLVGILDKENKLLAQGRQRNKTVDWTWIRKDCQ